MVKAPNFHCRGRHVDPWIPGWRSSSCYEVQPKKKKKDRWHWIPEPWFRYQEDNLESNDSNS